MNIGGRPQSRSRGQLSTSKIIYYVKKKYLGERRNFLIALSCQIHHCFLSPKKAHITYMYVFVCNILENGLQCRMVRKFQCVIVRDIKQRVILKICLSKIAFIVYRISVGGWGYGGLYLFERVRVSTGTDLRLRMRT